MKIRNLMRKIIEGHEKNSDAVQLTYLPYNKFNLIQFMFIEDIVKKVN